MITVAEALSLWTFGRATPWDGDRMTKAYTRRIQKAINNMIETRFAILEGMGQNRSISTPPNKENKMDYLSITEALLIQLVEQDDVDATNVVQKLRNAQTVIREEFHMSFLELHQERADYRIDDILITATQNGKRDIYA